MPSSLSHQAWREARSFDALQFHTFFIPPFSSLLLHFLFLTHTLLLLSSCLLVRIHSTLAAAVKRDIFHKQKIATEGVRACAPKKLFAFTNSVSESAVRSARLWFGNKNNKHIRASALCSDVMLPRVGRATSPGALTRQS